MSLCSVVVHSCRFYAERYQATNGLAKPIIGNRKLLESRRVSHVYSGLSEYGVRSANERLEECRRRLVREGSGEQCARRFCGLLNDSTIGNGGVLPELAA